MPPDFLMAELGPARGEGEGSDHAELNPEIIVRIRALI